MASAWGTSWGSAWGSAWGRVAEAVTSAVGGGGGKKKRKRVLKRDIYGTVFSAYEDVFRRKPEEKIVKEVAEKAIKSLPDDTALIFIRERIFSILLKMEEEEDEELAMFSML